MPLYEYKCVPCQKVREDMRTIDNRLKGPTCYICGDPMKLIISAVRGFVKNPAAGHTRRV